MRMWCAMRWLVTAGCLTVCGLTSTGGGTPAIGQDKPNPTDSADRDYATELPRIDPLSPADALASFEVAKGYRIEQLAAEPLLTDPVALAFDEDGRLYVVEMNDYSEQAEEQLGRVRRLVDRDGDGKFDEATVFAEGLSWPTAIICSQGGVYVGAPPHIYYLRDNDGDGKAEEQRIAYTGFGRSNVQGLLNSFQWGFDNRIHGATSSSGASVIRPDEPSEPLALRGRDFSIDTRTGEIDAISGGGQHGLSMNRWGDTFVCSNSDHLQSVLFEDRYVARNPYLSAPSARRSIAADGPQADVFRASPVEPWRIVRTRLRVQKIVPGVVEGGGRAAGYFTGATGVTIYRGNAWPAPNSEAPDAPPDAEWAIVGDVGSNLVHRKLLTADGVTYRGTRFDADSEFVRSKDIWFRPVQFANAPDGSLLILDMYREVIEHPASLPPVIKRHLDLTSGRDRGRLYRIVPEGFQQPPLPRLGSATAVELAETLAHPNGWHRDTALRLLYERRDDSAVPTLQRLARDPQTRPEGRIAALCALDGLGALNETTIVRALEDPHPEVRRHAVRLAERVVRSAETEAQLMAMVADDSLRVRDQLAFTLGELPGAAKYAALVRLILRDGADPDLRLAIRSSLGEGAGTVLELLAGNAQALQAKPVPELIRELATQIGKQQRGDDVAALLRVLAKPADPRLLEWIVPALALKAGTPLEAQVSAATGGRSAEVLGELLARSTKTALDDRLAPRQRADATLLLQLGAFGDQQETLAALLKPEQPAEVQAAALGAMSSWSDKDVAPFLVGRWRVLTPSLRARAGELLFSREPWTEVLLDAVEAGTIATADLDAARLRLLAAGSTSLAPRAKKLLAGSGSQARAEVIAQYRPALELAGDPARGRAVFQKNCSVCHRLEGAGHAIGPNLAAMQNRGREAILLNVLDPNREVNPQFLNYIVRTLDGRSPSGMIAAESATSLTLRRAENASDTVLRVDIDAMQSTGQSLMPEGMEKQIPVEAMGDLLRFLETIEN